MLTKDSIQASIFHALVSINEERDSDKQILINAETRLFGPEAVLDSLSLVSVIVDIEAAISAASGREISLTDDRAMSQTMSPFSDINTLTNYILLLLSKAA
jgi:hypothetical protein